MQYVRVSLTRSEADQPSLEVRPWEVPILEYLYGPERCVVIDERSIVKRDKAGHAKADASPQAEFDRLVSKYGNAQGGEKSVAVEVFGQGQIGVRALESLMGVRKAPAAPVTAPPPADDDDAELAALLENGGVEAIE